ncbi:MAG: hypothetical protein O3A19_06960 [Planctomycetota bacterium]|nr:hypothetical protein [Planctomycetota bacterium]MDA1026153.1 hypothetical protein [Planctomycetota bacterium]
MTRRPTLLRSGRRGGLLLETLIAIAIFVGVATFALGAVRDGIVAAERAKLRIVAVDLASSRIAAVEAGLISPYGSEDESSIELEVFEESPSPFRIEMEAEPSGFVGLVRVVVSVFEIDEFSSSTGIDERRLARLVALVPDGLGATESETPLEASEGEVEAR